MNTCREYEVYDGEKFLGYAYEVSEVMALLQFDDSTHVVRTK